MDPALREYEVSGLAAASTEYYFKLTAFNSIGEGSPTDEFSAFTPTDGLAFTLINTDTEYRVASGTVSNTAAAIAVPTYYEGKEVTAIGASGFLGANAFDGFTQLVSIQLPDGLKTIGNWAFQNCASLGVCRTSASRLDFCPFSLLPRCQNTHVAQLRSVFVALHQEKIIKNRLEALKSDRLLALTSLPDGVTVIEMGAFNGCTSLVLTSLPDGVKAIKPKFLAKKLVILYQKKIYK